MQPPPQVPAQRKQSSALGESKHLIVLPCQAEDLHHFISGLLGKPQTITKIIRGPFDVGKTEIENFFHLVDQRIRQQNKAALVSFTIRIIMSDGSSVLCQSLDDFLHYHEVRPVASDAVHLNWSYLITFPDRATPEKQQIDIAITASSLSFEDDDILLVSPGGRKARGAFRFRIEHTARTWGADIEALLTAHINSLIEPRPPLAVFAQEHSGKISLTTTLLFLASCLAGAFYVVNGFARDQLERVSALRPTTTVSTDELALQVYQLLEMAATGAWPKLTLYLVVFLVFAVFAALFLGMWQGSALDDPPPSFVRVTKEADRAKEKTLKEKKRTKSAAVLSFVIQVLVGVTSNMLFSWVTGQ